MENGVVRSASAGLVIDNCRAGNRRVARSSSWEIGRLLSRKPVFTPKSICAPHWDPLARAPSLTHRGRLIRRCVGRADRPIPRRSASTRFMDNFIYHQPQTYEKQWHKTNKHKQEAQLSLTNRQMLVHADIKILTQNAMKPSFSCCAVKTQELPSGEWLQLLARFCDFYLPIFHLTPPIMGILSSYRVHIWYGKTRNGLQCGEGRMMIDFWAQYIYVTDRQTDKTATTP